MISVLLGIGLALALVAFLTGMRAGGRERRRWANPDVRVRPPRMAKGTDIELFSGMGIRLRADQGEDGTTKHAKDAKQERPVE